MKRVNVLLCALCAVFLTTAGFGQTTHWVANPADSDWHNPLNWDTGAVPPSGSVEIGRNWPTVEITQNAGTIMVLRLGTGVNPPGGANVYLLDGGYLNLQRALITGIGSSAAAGSSFVVDGGTLIQNYQAAQDRWLQPGGDRQGSIVLKRGTIDAGSVIIGRGSQSTGSFIEISGGTFTQSNSSAVFINGTDNSTCELRIVGSASSVNIRSYTQGLGSDLTALIDAGGVTEIFVTGDVTFSNYTTLNVEFLTANPIPGQYSIMKWTGNLTNNGLSLSSTLGSDISMSIVQGDGYSQLLVTVVPEPATMLLLGLGAVLIRRKK